MVPHIPGVLVTLTIVDRKAFLGTWKRGGMEPRGFQIKPWSITPLITVARLAELK